MSFLYQTELKTIVDVNLIDKITANDPDIVTLIIDESVEVMKSYMAKYYDIDTIFNATLNNRNKSVLKRLKDIVAFEIYTRNKGAINETIHARYTEAMHWLEELNTGKFYDRTLPVLPTDASTPAVAMRLGSDTKYSNFF